MALTNLADVPARPAEAAGQALIGTAVDDAAIEKAAAAAIAIIDPASDLRGPAEFRKHVAGVMVRARSDAHASVREAEHGEAADQADGQRQAVEALVEPRTLLIDFLREELGLTGTHIGRETSHCGACTVDLDGRSVKSCTLFAVQADGGMVMTVEGHGRRGGLHPIQAALHRATRPAVRLLYARHDHAHLPAAAGEPGSERGRDPHRPRGNLCRCTGYQNIVKAVRDAADRLRSTSSRASEAAE